MTVDKSLTMGDLSSFYISFKTWGKNKKPSVTTEIS